MHRGGHQVGAQWSGRQGHSEDGQTQSNPAKETSERPDLELHQGRGQKTREHAGTKSYNNFIDLDNIEHSALNCVTEPLHVYYVYLPVEINMATFVASIVFRATPDEPSSSTDTSTFKAKLKRTHSFKLSAQIPEPASGHLPPPTASALPPPGPEGRTSDGTREENRRIQILMVIS